MSLLVDLFDASESVIWKFGENYFCDL